MAYADLTVCCNDSIKPNRFLSDLYKNLNNSTLIFSRNNSWNYCPVLFPFQPLNLYSYNNTNLFFPFMSYPNLPERTLSVKPADSQINLGSKETEELQKTKKETIFKNKGSALQEEGFLDEVKSVAERINCDYKDLLAVMNAECGLNPQAKNKRSGAVGLIQFMPKTAERLGTSSQELSNMSATDQLIYVEKFLKNCKKRYGFSKDTHLSGADLYSLLFLPARAKRNVLCSAGETNKNGKLLRYYEGNKGMDLDKDGKITKKEIAARVDKFRLQEIAVA